ncbi:hypothetical protein IID24_05985, partial [Patescibacteria group bacterium]|nr:hypothetical protein [Patescibacteria group bacterium]
RERYPKLEEKLKEIFGEEDKQEEEEEFDVTEHSYILMPKIDQVEKKRDDIAGVLVGGVRTVGEYLMGTDTVAAKIYIDYLEEKNRTIFKRIMIYLLKFAPNEEQWNDRINSIISDREQFCTFALKEEYKVLLHDKWEEISDAAKEEYVNWAKEQRVDDEEEYKKWFLDVKKQEITAQDIEAYNNKLRAEALYCIRDKCPDLYGEYLRASGVSEEEVKPKPPIQVSGGWTGEPSKSPLKPETMKTMAPVEVVKYVLDYDTNHPDTKEDEHAWEEDDPKEALANAFKLDVVERAMEYVKTDATLIVQMGRRYVRNFFYGLDEALNTQKLKNPDWGLILEISKLFIEKYGMNKEYEAATQTVPKILERGLKEEFCPIPMDENILNKVLGILRELLKIEDDTDVDEGGDPISGCINCVQGVAFENFVQFGLYCKKRDPKLYERQYASGFKRTLQNILDHVEKVKILCVFGEYFSNLCWIEEAWVRENLDRIFSEEDARQWDAIWGAYINWDHPTKVAFKMASGKYEHAIDRIGQKNRFKYDEDIDKKLVEHLMLAYWQGWEEDNTLLNSLLNKASDELLAKASQYLSSGFGYLKEHEKDVWREGVENRLLEYWQQRFDIMQKNPKEHQLEAQEFTGWVKDSPLKKEDTFRLLQKALVLTGGRVGLYADVSMFVEGV